MILPFVIFIISLGVLIIAAKFFTEAAERIGLSLKMSPFMVGVVIVAIGTSLPELISGIIASVTGHSEIVIGNVLGANISNIFLILGMATIVAKRSIKLGKEYIFIDLHFMLGSATFLVLFLLDGEISRIEGACLVVGFIVYQVYLMKSDKPDEMPTLNDPETVKKMTKVQWKDVLILLVAALGIFIGAKYVVQSIQDIALALHVDKTIISLTVLSLGTTLPELAVTISAARRGQPEIAVGNILGSCIFNSFMVTGVASLIRPIEMPFDLAKTSVIFLIVAAVFFYLLSQDKKVSKWEGMLFLLFYAVFIAKITGIA
ncbi:MAG: calcium/sodium antiporter [Bacteroidetes bacterium]|jgi:cation:H+ antiporter|nr:calcium/sodium antiporter [Bacteroidota bacterium]